MSKLYVCVGGGEVATAIKCIYLPPTYLYFIQDIEDRCLLLMSSTSFVDPPFQEHQMMKKHHMDQNPYISSLCPKPGVVTDNMTWGDDVAQSSGPSEPKWGRQSGWFANHSKSFICFSCVICAFTYHIVELVFVFSYIRSLVWELIEYSGTQCGDYYLIPWRLMLWSGGRS
jgi:hypothetical protein